MMHSHTISYERYQRQLILKGFGKKGQQQLLQAAVLVVGAGGLGSPALQYLAAAGVGRIGIVDDDVVALHNLHRQVLYTTDDIGQPKAEAAATRLRQMNPDVVITAFPFRLTPQNVFDTIAGYTIVLDATDNFATRYLLNDACVLLGRPLVYGAIAQFEGQVAVFNRGENSVNYRDLFPQPPPPGSVLNCAEAGVLGVLPGIIGTMQATEVIKLVTGIGEPLANRLFTYNALTNESFVFALTAKAETSLLLPKTKNQLEATDYEWLCQASPVEEIDTPVFNELLQQAGTLAVDVREEGEEPCITAFAHAKMPLSTLANSLSSLNSDTVIFFCQSGKRSREAARLFSTTFGRSKKAYSLRGGILQWKNDHHGKKA